MKKSKEEKIFIWGASGQAKVLLDILALRGDAARVTHFFDKNETIEKLNGLPVLGGWDSFLKWSKKNKENYSFVVAVGADNKGRLELQEKIKKYGHRPLTVIHPSAIIAGNAEIGEGSQILPGAIICAEAKVGRAVIVNTGASVDHESIIEDGVHIMPKAVITGCVKISKYVQVGSNATIFPRIKIGESAIVGAGSVIMKDIPEREIWVGVPGKFLRKI
jgi:sugar O-acyltransferase (sialic acid O-acetyltransferase NeuD family)